MRALDELTGLVSSKFEVIKDLITMIKLETRLAGLSVFPLLVSLCVLFVVTITVWLSAMILLGYGISIAYNSILLAITAILIFNLICLLLLAKYLLYNLKKMSFEKTYHQRQHPLPIVKRDHRFIRHSSRAGSCLNDESLHWRKDNLLTIET
jgi:predicted membrane protein